MGGVAYLNMPKAGCTSILRSLTQLSRDQTYQIPDSSLPDGSDPIHGFDPPHAHLEWFFARWPLDFPRLPVSMMTFTFVRNPYDRLLSFYKSKVVGGQAPFSYYQRRLGITRSASFADLVNKITSTDPALLEHHAAPQSMILCDDTEARAAFVGRLEDIARDWEVIQKLTGLRSTLGRCNTTPASPAPLYNRTLRDRVYEYYRNDFELFGYARDAVECSSHSVTEATAPVYVGHLLPSAVIRELRGSIAGETRRVRRVAEEYEQDPGRRTEFFDNQGEAFREMLQKAALRREMVIPHLVERRLSHADHELQRLKRIHQKYLLSRYGAVQSGWRWRLARVIRGSHGRELRLLKSSTLFDSEFYLRENPEVAESRLTPEEHYLRVGAREGKDPAPGFRTIEYLVNHPMLVESGGNPLIHHILEEAKRSAGASDRVVDGEGP
jgi:hypothetical protein